MYFLAVILLKNFYFGCCLNDTRKITYGVYVLGGLTGLSPSVGSNF